MKKLSIFNFQFLILLALFTCAALSVFAQEADDEYHYELHQPYQYPAEPEVLANLREWQDLKFGLMVCWGIYSQWGIVESWTLCPEDAGWNSRPEGSSYSE
ncbi:MAG: alpha-L-fucosidase, partial [Tannerella sp.]|nr:alpha-L-fucosidase [Tannerella sp.]